MVGTRSQPHRSQGDSDTCWMDPRVCLDAGIEHRLTSPWPVAVGLLTWLLLRHLFGDSGVGENWKIRELRLMCGGVDWTYLAQDRLQNEAVVIYFKALFNNSFGETEKKHEKLQSRWALRTIPQMQSQLKQPLCWHDIRMQTLSYRF